MSKKLIVCAFWAEGDPNQHTEAMAEAMAAVPGLLKYSGACVSIDGQEIASRGWWMLLSALAPLDLAEVARPPGGSL